jgi:hypothetical protein
MEIIRDTADFVRRLADYFSSGVQVIQIPVRGQITSATSAVKTAIERSYGADFPIRIWDPVTGIEGKYKPMPEALNAIQASGGLSEAGVTIFLNSQYELNKNAAALHMLAWGAGSNSFSYAKEGVKRGGPVVLITPDDSIHADLRPYVKCLPYPFPDDRALSFVVDSIAQAAKTACEEKDLDWHDPEPEMRDRLARALTGLSSQSASDAISLSYRVATQNRSQTDVRSFGDDMLPIIEEEKALAFRRSKLLTYIPRTRLAAADLGGYDQFTQWLARQAKAMSPEAEAIQLDAPKGCLLAGIPGTGKTCCARLAAHILQLPLVILDASSVLNSLVGESESQMRDALSSVSAISNCVFAVDEVDKMIVDGLDGHEVTRRLIGILLTWMSEKKDKSFVMMMANRVKGMPPEFLRKGRFDRIFSVDVPRDDQRREIFSIHLAKRGVSAESFTDAQWKDVVKASNQFVGAEIEAVVVAARQEVFFNEGHGNVGAKDLIEACKAVNPMAKTQSIELQSMRDSLKDIATPVCIAEQKAGVNTRALQFANN